MKNKTPILNIGTKTAGGSDLFFIVEEGQANQGDLKKAIRMMDAAALAGADAIEFQLAKAEDFYIKGDPGYGIYLKREFKNEQLKELIEHTKGRGLEFITVPLSHKLVEPAAKFGCSAFNINASDLTNPDIIDAVIDSGLPFFLSLPLASEKEVRWAIDRIIKRGVSHFALLHGQHVMASGDSGVAPEHANLGFIGTLKEKYDFRIGFIDHTPLKWFPAAAVAAGAEIVSKHMTLSHKDKGPDRQVCLDPAEMKQAVSWARDIRKSIMEKSKKLAPGENIDKAKMRRSIVTAKKLKRGDIIKRADVIFKRPGTGICPSLVDHVVSKRVKKDVGKDMIITWDVI